MKNDKQIKDKSNSCFIFHKRCISAHRFMILKFVAMKIIKSQSSPKVRVLIIPSSNAFMTINKNASIQDIFVSESITD